MAVSSEPRGPAAPPAGPDGRAVAPSEVSTPAQPAATSATIEVRGAGKQFGDTWVVRDLTFGVAAGTIFGLFGPSGSGKTTTIRLLLGLLGPDEGEIRVLGTAPRRFRARLRARIGYLPQLFVLYPELSVLENMHLVASLYGLGWLRRRVLIRQQLEFVELWEHRRKLATDLSGGMKRRLELAAALVHDPELLIVDEPTAGVDPILRSKFWDHFRALRDQGKTIVVTSQYVTEAEYCDRAGVLGGSKLVALGSPEEIREQAMGGEMVDVEADGLDRHRAELLARLDGVRLVRFLAYDHLRLTVEQAGSAIPQILSTLQDNGVEVKQAQEYRPNFDEVFVQLMEQAGVRSAE